MSIRELILGKQASSQLDVDRSFLLEKGRRANIGEIREWKGVKYQKNSSGWSKVKSKPKTKMEEFVDEDTGEIVQVEVKIENKKVRKDSPSHDRRVRKLEEMADRALDKKWATSSEVQSLESEINDLETEMKSLKQDMEVEAGMYGDRWTDVEANRYGRAMNKIDEKTDKIRKKLNIAIERHNTANDNFNKIDSKLYQEKGH